MVLHPRNRLGSLKVEPLGDAAYVLRDLPAPAHRVAEALRQLALPGVEDVAPCYDTVGVYLSAPGLLDPGALRESAERAPLPPERPPRLHRVPVCYELGEDLEAAAESLGLAPREFAEIHCSVEYDCFAMGFCPGFAYLGWLPDAISGLPRRGTPRVRVEPGSVGVTGRQTAVYPLPRPGGWSLIGRTPLTLVDVEAGYFPIRAGDRVAFFSIEAGEFEARRGERLEAAGC